MWALLLSLCWAGELEERAQRLAELRTEVATLAADVQAERDSLRGQLRALDVERAELQGQVRREELRLTELQVSLQTRRDELGVVDEQADTLKPAVLEGLAELRVQVAAGIPYRRDERLASVDALTEQVRSGELRSEKGLGRAWQLIEDELRLTQQTALDRQVVQWGGEERLVTVARVGMVAMYARDGQQVAQARRRDDGWVWEDLGANADVLSLFDALDRQVHAGWFTLPGLPLEAR